MIELTTKVVQKDEILASKLDDEVMMMNLESNHYYAMDPVGSHIWQLLQQPITIADLCTSLHQEFEVDEETCQQDTVTFIQQMLDEKLVRIVSS